MESLWKNLIDLSLVLSGKFFSVGVVFLAGMLVARIAGPNEYGVFSVAISAVLMCDGMIGSPLDMAAVRFSGLHQKEPARIERFQAMAMHLKFILAIAFFVCVLGLRTFLGRWFPHLTDSSFPLLSCFCATVALLLARSVSTSLQIRHHFRQYSVVDIAQGATRTFAFLLLATLQLTRAGIYVFAYGLVGFGVVACGLLFLNQDFLLGSWPTKPDILRMLRYSGYAAGIIAMGSLTGRGDLLMLATVKGSRATSVYGLASQIAMLVAQISMYASVLTQPRVIRLAKLGRLRKLFLANLLAVACVTPVALIVLSSNVLPWIITSIFGARFAPSIPLLQVLLTGTFLDLLIVPVLMVYCIQTCPKKTFCGESLITGGFIFAGMAAAAGQLSWPPEQAMAFVAVSVRVAKLILYGGLFLAHTSPRTISAL
jgi:O-antigen/teichoic acid export membrane protein